VQHGAVHPYLSIFAAVPAVWVFGPTLTALAFNPFFLALAGFILGHLVFRVLRSPGLALLLPVCFWMSEWISRTLLYEMHPEAAYPAFAFAAAFCVLKAAETGREKYIWFILSLLSFFALTGVKQDGMLLAGLMWLWLSVRRCWSLALALSSGAVIAGTAVAMALIVQGFRSGSLGAISFAISDSLSAPVAIPEQTTGVLGGRAITGLSSIFSILSYFVESAGGSWGLVKQVGRYFVANPFLSFALVAPWIWMGLAAWLLVFPMAVLFAIVGPTVGGLQNYYSAPLVALFWLAVLEAFTWVPAGTWRSRAAIWLAAATAFLGANGPKIYFPNAHVSQLLYDADKISSEMRGLGVVSSRLVTAVPKEKIWSERLVLSGAPSLEPPEFVKWVLLPKELGSYEISRETAAAWREWALASGRWQLTEAGGLELYQRKP